MTRSAYGLPTPAEDARITHVGPGAPAGELLRRYWHPVALSAEVTDLPAGCGCWVRIWCCSVHAPSTLESRVP